MWCIVPAAGIGSRMGDKLPKQYHKLQNDQTVLDTTIQKLLESEAVTKVLVVLRKSDSFWQYSQFCNHACVQTCTGGKERVDSVLAGLKFLTQHIQSQDWVLVHDAARACVDHEDIDGLVDVVEGSESIGGLLALPVYETVKQVDYFNRSQQTVDRAQLWLAQTPQIFPYKLLKNAIQNALKEGVAITDEASAIEHAGYKPLLVKGSRKNIKVTEPEDIALANLFLGD